MAVSLIPVSWCSGSGAPLLCQCDGTPVVVAYRDWMLGCNRITYVICYELAPSVQIFLMEDRSILLKQSGRSKRG